jgi:hypothetical protein
VDGTLTLSKTAWNLTSGGTRYVVGNNFRIDGTYFGGTSPANDIIISVTGVNSYGAITNFTVNGTMPTFPIYKPVILDFVDSANYIRDASELTTANREVNIYNEKRSGSTIQGQGKVEISQGNQFRTSYLFGQLKSGAGFGGAFNYNGISSKPENSSFTPASIAGLSLWLDASDSASVRRTGAKVTAWNDKSGNVRNATAPQAKPTYVSNALNGLSTLRFSNPTTVYDSGYQTQFLTVSPVFNPSPGDSTALLNCNDESCDGESLSDSFKVFGFIGLFKTSSFSP